MTPSEILRIDEVSKLGNGKTDYVAAKLKSIELLN